jgi:hypothetical protein
MDAAHELAHLLLHHDAEPGSHILERQATTFASQFLAPTSHLRDELPGRLDFDRLHELERRWGMSLKALIYRGHAMGVYRDHTYRRGMSLLAERGYSEPGDLGPRESRQSSAVLCGSSPPAVSTSTTWQHGPPCPSSYSRPPSQPVRNLATPARRSATSGLPGDFPASDRPSTP